MKGVVSVFLNFFKTQAEGSKDQELKPLSRDDMAKQCLHFYLEKYKTMLLEGEGFFKGFRVDVFAKDVAHIYLQHHFPKLKYRHDPPHYVIIDSNKNVSGCV